MNKTIEKIKNELTLATDRGMRAYEHFFDSPPNPELFEELSSMSIENYFCGIEYSHYKYGFFFMERHPVLPEAEIPGCLGNLNLVLKDRNNLRKEVLELHEGLQSVHDRLVSTEYASQRREMQHMEIVNSYVAELSYCRSENASLVDAIDRYEKSVGGNRDASK